MPDDKKIAHEMVFISTDLVGEELWFCPECRRRVIDHESKGQVVLIEGDPSVPHIISRSADWHNESKCLMFWWEYFRQHPFDLDGA